MAWQVCVPNSVWRKIEALVPEAHFSQVEPWLLRLLTPDHLAEPARRVLAPMRLISATARFGSGSLVTSFIFFVREDEGPRKRVVVDIQKHNTLLPSLKGSPPPFSISD